MSESHIFGLQIQFAAQSVLIFSSTQPIFRWRVTYILLEVLLLFPHQNQQLNGQMEIKEKHLLVKRKLAILRGKISISDKYIGHH